MSQEPESREEAIARLQKSASDLETRTTPKISHEIAGQKAAGQAWKFIADLFGGVFVGLAIGFGRRLRTSGCRRQANCDRCALSSLAPQPDAWSP